MPEPLSEKARPERAEKQRLHSEHSHAPSGCLSSVIAVVLALAGSAPGLAQEPSGRVLVLTGATIIDGVADAPLLDRSIVIEGSTIEAILPADSPLPVGVETVDLDGRYVIPGLMDSHVALAGLDGRAFLNHGVTSVREACWRSTGR